jgi:hypothetical protein
MTNSVLFATLAVLAATGCSSTTGPDTADLNTIVAFPTLNNASGAPTILDARLLLDGVSAIEQTGASGFASAALYTGQVSVTSGRHTLTFLLVSQTTSVPTRYTVPKFTITVYACTGGTIEDTDVFSTDLKQDAETASLTAGQSITYTFDTPDCDLPDSP